MEHQEVGTGTIIVMLGHARPRLKCGDIPHEAKLRSQVPTSGFASENFPITGVNVLVHEMQELLPELCHKCLGRHNWG
eukprot:11587925-Alexandrium_andersonii.AAC.1